MSEKLYKRKINLRQKEYDYSVTFIDIRAKMLGDTTNEQACESELTQALNS